MPPSDTSSAAEPSRWQRWLGDGTAVMMVGAVIVVVHVALESSFRASSIQLIANVGFLLVMAGSHRSVLSRASNPHPGDRLWSRIVVFAVVLGMVGALIVHAYAKTASGAFLYAIYSPTFLALGLLWVASSRAHRRIAMKRP
jgi:hypothetical protein